MLKTSRRFLRHAALTPALLALAFVAACVDPAAGPTASTQPLPKADENVYVATMDSGISIPALPVEQIPETHRRQVVAYETDQPVGTIIINPKSRLLYYVVGKNKAIRYGISVGRAGFEWSGEAIVAEKKPWPTWTPPKEMIARDPKLAKWENGQPGGPTNPLGARAIYLTSGGKDYGYRIHGTPDWKSIGRNASSGCIRMINQDVIDLYGRIQGGEKVIVLTASGEMPKGLYIPKPPAPKVAAKPKAAETVIPAGAVPALTVLPPPSIAVGTPATPTPAAAPTTTTATDPAAPACKVPLVNGTCPPGN
ncbi:L,D-transpeptidase [Rhodobacter sp. SY28-1]|uniref:L,D-transpeptidase n=1 Tax=Rhodobacter sp. SY28-1 TaxID=2562317 RepID=UPI00197F89F6|nr:L,D-transpeptidase [Rhodobacter sp. SY28-1]